MVATEKCGVLIFSVTNIQIPSSSFCSDASYSIIYKKKESTVTRVSRSTKDQELPRIT
jgi:hypothetical protein